MENKKVWYVTGASKGLGLALVKVLLEQGYRVAATSRYRRRPSCGGSSELQGQALRSIGRAIDGHGVTPLAPCVIAAPSASYRVWRGGTSC